MLTTFCYACDSRNNQMEVQTRIAQCWGGGDVALGHPIEYINLDGTTLEDPAVCKYCGLRYFLGHQH